MSELSKITSDHRRRRAVVYVRQSSTTQVEHNRESTARQYQLAEHAVALGWARDQVTIVDEDLGVSGSGLAERAGFARMTAEVALGEVGIVLGWKSRAWLATTPTGTACSICAESPTRSSAMPTGSIIRACSTIAWCWA
jgi:hypothetical protein